MDEKPGNPSPPETPEALYERIRRRRTGGTAFNPPGPASGAAPVATPGTSGLPSKQAADPVAPRSATGRAVEVDEVLEAQATASGAAPSAASPGAFPRSATMRLLLKHPEFALGVGLPAAGLILGFPKSRRLIGAAIRLGTRPELQQAMQLTSVLRQRGRRRSRSDPESG
jgi:hypothetical protein